MTHAPISPGGHLAGELKELGMSAGGLARQTKVPVSRVTGIINSQRGGFGQLSVEWLMRFLVALGQDIEIVVKPHTDICEAAQLRVGRGTTSAVVRISRIACFTFRQI